VLYSFYKSIVESETLNMQIAEISSMISRLVPEEGPRKNIIDNVDLFRIERSMDRVPFNYSNSIIFILQGQKRVYIADSMLTYDPMHYLVLTVPLPVECDVVASKEKPLLGVSIQVNANMVNEIMVSGNIPMNNTKELPYGIYSDDLNEQMTDVLYRLVDSLKSPSESKVLAPMYIREILYRALTSKNGEVLRMLAYRNQTFYKINNILEKIHENYGMKFDVASLAKEADMSTSAFHTAFKAITDASPIQYIKKVKLHKARDLILYQGLNASSAAYQVGYESPSQFTREYKRMFRVTPGQEVFG
jgi:AraC-like DNA-binding protein